MRSFSEKRKGLMSFPPAASLRAKPRKSSKKNKQTGGPASFDLMEALEPRVMLSAVFQEPATAGNLVAIEAENFASKVSRSGKDWTAVSNSLYTGGTAMQALSDSGMQINSSTTTTSTSPQIDYTINFTQTGIHYIWIRGAGANEQADSVHVGLDGVIQSTSDNVSYFGQKPNWSNKTMGGPIATINVATTGVHTLSLYMREDGFVADKIALTTSASFIATDANTPLTAGTDTTPPPTTITSPDAGLLTLQAEAYNSKIARGGQDWTTISKSTLSGGLGVQVLPDMGVQIDTNIATTSPQLNYTVNIPTAGIYYIWLRGVSYGESSDSAHIGLDGVVQSTSDKITGFGGSPGWSNKTMDGTVASISVATAGVHTLNLFMREDGFLVDQISLTPNALYSPTNTGTGTVGSGDTTLGTNTGSTITNTVTVSDTTSFVSAINAATPGTQILVNPGTYSSGKYFVNLKGTADKHIVIAAADPTNKPIFTGSGEGMKFVDAAYVDLKNLIFQNTSDNGLNMDDGGSYATPSHHILLDGLEVRNVGSSTGNIDGIKLSGVDNFTIRNCRVTAWGGGYGSGIDMVGCHYGIIENNYFSNGDTRGADAVQAKGGSSNMIIRQNRFEHAGGRAIQLGGNTGLQYFRPYGATYEARNIDVVGNVIIGSGTPIAFANADQCTFRFNTVYNPTQYLLRILSEDRTPGIISTGNDTVSDNIFYYTGALPINIGNYTLPATFTFARNAWYRSDAPTLSKPVLPSVELGGIYGLNPLFVNAIGGDFHLQSTSPTANEGAYAPGATA